jgi:hypothetical protein
LVLLLVAGVVVQETFAGQLGHLFVDEALLIKAITQAFLGDAGVQADAAGDVVGAEWGGAGTMDLIAACAVSMRAGCLFWVLSQ